MNTVGGIRRLLSACVLLQGLAGTMAQAAVITIGRHAVRPTPRVLAYNMGHFHPGSNAADWWRYSRASGARIFLSPSHIHVDGSERPGDAEVVDQASFLARRAALSSDPLNTGFINWPLILERFDTVLGGNNKIIPNYALGC